MFRDLTYALLDLVYPPQCLVCRAKLLSRPSAPGLYPSLRPSLPSGLRSGLPFGRPSFRSGLCLFCLERIHYNTPPFCLKCSRPLAHLNPYAHCSDCLTKEPAFDFAWCACLYDDPLKSLIHQFKYNQGTFLRHLFHHVIISFIKTYHLDTQQFDFIVPIPLHPTRYRERGYNQAELLAGELARTLTIPLKRCLIRWRYTPSQALLAQKERWTNISGAFKINGHNNIRGKAILLVDDLLTTGATVNEAASTLKEAGARRVGVLTLAITPLRSTVTK